MTDWIARTNARSRRVSSLVLKVLLAWPIGAITLAILIPALRRNEVELRAWMVWAVILASLAICVGPELLARLRRRE